MVATAGGAEITADSLLYWLTYGIDGSAQYYSMLGMGEMPWDTEVDGKTLEEALMDSALQTAALYALLPGLAEQEGAAASPMWTSGRRRLWPPWRRTAAAIRCWIMPFGPAR